MGNTVTQKKMLSLKCKSNSSIKNTATFQSHGWLLLPFFSFGRNKSHWPILCSRYFKLNFRPPTENKYDKNRNLGFLYQDFPLLFPNAPLCHEWDATDTADKVSPELIDFSPFPSMAQFLLKLSAVLPLHPLGHSEAYDLCPRLCLAVPALSNVFMPSCPC